MEKPKRRLPAWFVPLLALLLILAVIFWAAPMLFSRLQLAVGRSDNNGAEVARVYDSDTWVVKKTAADVLTRDDLKARRVTQALYNEPVTVLSDDTLWGFFKVRLSDNTSGYMLKEDLADNRESIEPSNASFKLVVIANSKRIMSHARSGTMLAEVVMGTVLHSDYKGDGILRVLMPDGQTGWMSEDGLVVMPPDAPIEVAPEGARYFCSSIMAFHHVTILENGQSMSGASITGAARVAAFVNGVILPRSIQGQAGAGEAVRYTDLPDLMPGDLVFVDDAANPGQPVDMAVVMENGQFLMAPASKTSIELVDPERIPDWTDRILHVRRIFPRNG